MSAPPQDEFVAKRKDDWRELDSLLSRGKDLYSYDGATIATLAARYRALCTDLVRAQSAGYSQDLLGYLNGIAARAHSALYGARPLRIGVAVDLIARAFPRALRKNWRLGLCALLLFLIPCAVGLIGSIASPEFARHVLPARTLEEMAEAYSKGFDAGRGTGTNAGMAGFYVYNNVGIAFRCFATGILFGLGSLFFLVYNGLMIGTVTGFVTTAGFGHNILTFMCGHAPFELTAILIAGTAGLRMGYALIDTGGATRLGSLRASAGEIGALVMGAAAMLIIAAAIEGFWSPSSAPAPVKWAVAAAFSLGVTLFLVRAGRPVRAA